MHNFRQGDSHLTHRSLMPTMTIGDRTVSVERLMLDLDDVAPIFRRSRDDLRGLVASGALTNVSSGREVGLDPEEVARMIEREVEEGTLSSVALIELARLVETPRPRRLG